MEKIGKRIGVLSSHNGSGFETIANACNSGELNAEVVVVISNNSTAKVLEKAKSKNIPNFIINTKLYPNDNLDEKIANIFKEYNCDLIFLSGYMKKIEQNMLKAFPNAIINSHPALLPKYGGEGMYGSNVHKAVIQNGEKVSGSTIHFVNENYDEGKHILQKEILLDENETWESLENRIKDVEKVAIIEALKRVI